MKHIENVSNFRSLRLHHIKKIFNRSQESVGFFSNDILPTTIPGVYKGWTVLPEGDCVQVTETVA